MVTAWYCYSCISVMLWLQHHAAMVTAWHCYSYISVLLLLHQCVAMVAPQYCYSYISVCYGCSTVLLWLQHMDALDGSQELTELGRHLADLPVEPHLGKMVLHSIVLKCLDPVLTIVCALSYKDPCKA